MKCSPCRSCGSCGLVTLFVSVLGSWVLPCIAYCGFSKTFRGAEVLCVVSIFIASLPILIRFVSFGLTAQAAALPAPLSSCDDGGCHCRLPDSERVTLLMCVSARLCPTLRLPMGCGSPCDPSGASIHGILQERIREWVAISSSRGASGPGTEPGSPSLQADSLRNGRSLLVVTVVRFHVSLDHT